MTSPTPSTESTELRNGWVPCPKCRGTALTQPRYTWWGGFIGPLLFSHVECQGCGTEFNAKTGRSNTAGIVLFPALIVALIVVGAYLAFNS